MDYIDGLTLTGLAAGAAYIANYVIQKKERKRNLEINAGLYDLRQKQNMLDLIKGLVAGERSNSAEALSTFNMSLLEEILEEYPEYRDVIDRLKAQHRANLDKDKPYIEIYKELVD